MKRFGILSLVLLSFLALNSCDDDIFDKGGGNIHYGVSFRKVDLSGASSLVLASGKSEDSKSWTRSSMSKAGDGGDGGGDEQHTDFDYSAPLYKVSADGTMVEVDYDIEVTTSSDAGGEIKDSLKANLRLKIEYIYGINDKWLMLYNCNYDYPGYDELPDGNFKAAINRLINDGNNINRNYMVRQEDGALFLLETGERNPGLGRERPHTQTESQGAMEMIGNDIYYLDCATRLCRMEDRGNTLNLVQVLSNNVFNDYILSNGSVLGVVPKYETASGQSQMGMPSVVFPGQNSVVPISGINLDDKEVQMFLIDDELYVSRKNGFALDSIEYPLGDAYLVVGNEEYQMFEMGNGFNTQYGVYNVPIEAGSKIYIKSHSNDTILRAWDWSEWQSIEGSTYCRLSDSEDTNYPELEITETGNYEVYINLIGWSAGGELQISKEGWSSGRDPYFVFGKDRYMRGDEAALYKVVTSGNTASLSEEPVIRYIGESPHFISNGSWGYDTRHSRIISGGILSWIDIKETNYWYVQERTTMLSRIDLNTMTYSSVELSERFPIYLSEYYDGVAYVADGNKGYYACSLVTGTENYVPFDFSALSQYSGGMATLPSDAVFLPEIMAYKMTAFMIGGTQLDFYVDVLGDDAGKARVYATEGSGSGMVISSLVRLN